MAKPRFLTEDEARTLTRAEIVDRLYAESAWWSEHGVRTDRDRADYDVFTSIMHTYVDPGAGLHAVKDLLEGRPNDYWEQKVEPPAPEREAP